MKGRKAGDLNGEARALAEEMGYHWADNADPAVPILASGFRSAEISVFEQKRTTSGSVASTSARGFPSASACMLARTAPPAPLAMLA